MIQKSKRILLAFSGGIDSYAAAQSLRESGYDVELLTIDMLGDVNFTNNAIERAKDLSMPHHIVEEQILFDSEIVDHFTSEYISGRTPAPCTRCNSHIKWTLLAREADRLGIYNIATGHYFKVTQHNGSHFVARGLDPRKDQSYYLWDIKEEILKRIISPMGEQFKEEVKAKSSIKSESMGICFLRGVHYADFLAQRCGDSTLRSGDILDSESRMVIAQHNGIARYTIGQRKGEGIPSGRCVIEIDGARNQIIVGLNEQLLSREIEISECHFIDPIEAFSASNIEVMVRGIGRNPDGYAHLTHTSNGVMIHLDSGCPAWAVAPGQPVALYINDRVIGGGFVR